MLTANILSFFFYSVFFFFFKMSELEDELERRTLTYTLWKQSSNDKKRQSWHPVTFEYADVSPQHINEMRVIPFSMAVESHMI